MESGKKRRAFRELPETERLYRLAHKYHLREEVYERALKAAIALFSKPSKKKGS